MPSKPFASRPRPPAPLESKPDEPRPLAAWRIIGAFAIDAPAPFAIDKPVDLAREVPRLERTARRLETIGPGRRSGHHRPRPDLRPRRQARRVRLFRDLQPAARSARMLIGSDDTLTVWLNGKTVYDFRSNRSYSPATDRSMSPCSRESIALSSNVET